MAIIPPAEPLNEVGCGCWRLHAEGGDSVVYSFSGTDPLYVGKVLRLKKCRLPLDRQLDLMNSAQETAGLTDPESLRQGVRTIQDSLCYQHTVIRSLLGAEFVLAGSHNCQLVSFDRSFAARLAVQTEPLREKTRRSRGSPWISLGVGLLLLDVTLAARNDRDSYVFCVELKPKCGFLPHWEHVKFKPHVKCRKSRYQLLQQVKLARKDIAEASRYDPLDLFSFQQQRMVTALLELMLCPQNNFRFFVNGVASEVREFLSLEAGCSGLPFSSMHELAVFLSRILLQSPLLDNILQAQKLDRWDIENIYNVFQSVDHALFTAPACGGWRPPHMRPHYPQSVSILRQQLHDIPAEERIALVSDFLISQTVKDCSIMISFSPAKHSIFCVDLEPKRHSNIGRYFLEDRMICETNENLQ